MRRLIADPFRMGNEAEGDWLTSWSPPQVLPETSKLRATAAELERGLRPAAMDYMRWCTKKLMVLPARNASAEDTAYVSDNFIDACRHLPDDLWRAGTLKLLQEKTFRPSPAELIAAVGDKYRERQRMLERIRSMLSGRPPALPKPKSVHQMTPEERRGESMRRLREAIPILRKHARTGMAAERERELARLEEREPEAWAQAVVPQAAAEESPVNRHAPPLPPSPGLKASMLRAGAEFWSKQPGAEARAERLKRELSDATAPTDHQDDPMGTP
jgi:hypothetical protein